jgi:hypothetical protein
MMKLLMKHTSTSLIKGVRAHRQEHIFPNLLVWRKWRNVFPSSPSQSSWTHWYRQDDEKFSHFSILLLINTRTLCPVYQLIKRLASNFWESICVFWTVFSWISLYSSSQTVSKVYWFAFKSPKKRSYPCQLGVFDMGEGPQYF